MKIIGLIICAVISSVIVHNLKIDSWFNNFILFLILNIGLVGVMIIICGLFPTLPKLKKGKNEPDKYSVAELEKMQAEQQRKRDQALELYNEVIRTRKDECEPLFVEIAERLRSWVKSGTHKSITCVLDKIILPENTYLGVESPKKDGLGDVSKLFIKSKNSKFFISNQKNYNVFDVLSFENSGMGAWQAFLLHQVDCYLPRWWHANYGHRDYVYSKKDMSSILKKLHDRNEVLLVPTDADLLPTVYRNGNHYFISCVFWTEFGGLIREYYELVLNDDWRLTECINFKNITLYEYDCGIIY